MKLTGRSPRANAKPTLRKPAEDNTTALQQVLDNHTEELLWIAEVMTGSKQAGEHCLTETIQLADAAQYVGREWMFSWVKRLLVHVALKQISGNIRALLFPADPRKAAPLARGGASGLDQQQLRSISPVRLIALCDVLERACFILYGYLEYPMLDCALLLGCPRASIEGICERVLTKVGAIAQSSQSDRGEIDFFFSPGVTECAG
jgi:DNA-directed RNA polymerase specialized sigma24 family protein